MSSVITIPQPPSVPGETLVSDSATEIVFAPMDPDLYGEDIDYDIDAREPSEGEQTDTGCGDEEKAKERKKSLDILQSGPASSTSEGSDVEKVKQKPNSGKRKDKKAQAKVQRRPKSDGQDAVIVLKEEKVSSA